MKQSTIKRRILPLLFAAFAAFPIGGAWTSTTAAAAAQKAARSHTYKGSAVGTTWGPIQVAITVKSKKIKNVSVSDPTHTTRSQIIDNRAVPVLEQETLQAQSANISEVSGATTFSQAYIQSLQAAIKKAKQAKAL